MQPDQPLQFLYVFLKSCLLPHLFIWLACQATSFRIFLNLGVLMLIDRLLLFRPVLCFGCLEFVHRLTSNQIFFFLLSCWYRGHLLWIYLFARCLMYSCLLHNTCIWRSIIVIVFRWFLLSRCQITLFWRVWRHNRHLAAPCILWSLDCHLALLIVNIIELLVVATVIVALIYCKSVCSSLLAAVNYNCTCSSCLFMIIARWIVLLFLWHPPLLLHCLLTSWWRLLGWRSTIMMVVFLLRLRLIHVWLTTWVLIHQLLRQRGWIALAGEGWCYKQAGCRLSLHVVRLSLGEGNHFIVVCRAHLGLFRAAKLQTREKFVVLARCADQSWIWILAGLSLTDRVCSCLGMVIWAVLGVVIL